MNKMIQTLLRLVRRAEMVRRSFVAERPFRHITPVMAEARIYPSPGRRSGTRRI